MRDGTARRAGVTVDGRRGRYRVIEKLGAGGFGINKAQVLASARA